MVRLSANGDVSVFQVRRCCQITLGSQHPEIFSGSLLDLFSAHCVWGIHSFSVASSPVIKNTFAIMSLSHLSRAMLRSTRHHRNLISPTQTREMSAIAIGLGVAVAAFFVRLSTQESAIACLIHSYRAEQALLPSENGVMPTVSTHSADLFIKAASNLR